MDTYQDCIEGIRGMIKWIGDDPDRDGLKDTPGRVIDSWAELFSGYDEDSKAILMQGYSLQPEIDQMVVLKNIEFHSTCEHHLLPFFGTAHIAYIPLGKTVVGISKLARLLDIYARRLQIQERIAQQVTDALDKHLQSEGSACIIEAKHLCMCSRGVSKQHSVLTTSSLTGAFRTKPEARQELFSIIGRS